MHGRPAKWPRLDTIYPVPFRLLDDRKKYPNYGWVQMDLKRRVDKDFRPESYRPLRGIHEEIKVLDRIGTKSTCSRPRFAPPLMPDVYMALRGRM